MRSEKLRAFYTNGPITKSRAFGGAGNNTDVLRHDSILIQASWKLPGLIVELPGLVTGPSAFSAQ
ncbi:MAG TPA: hypothetical protein VE422_12535 [Terriglobia bacterium]|nr:hypothetical protein [Terriglobia bacterium]